jgi:hypothetical protein
MAVQYTCDWCGESIEDEHGWMGSKSKGWFEGGGKAWDPALLFHLGRPGDKGSCYHLARAAMRNGAAGAGLGAL